ncbi:MAG: fumarylacetoacetate hydrolase family protein [Planctomycetota bacterium]
MKLLRFGPRGREKPGLLDPDGIPRDASAIAPDYTPAFFANGGPAAFTHLDPTSLPAVRPGTRLGPPIDQPRKILCIGLNFADHAAETGSPVPDEPVVFMKPASAINGPTDPIVFPRDATRVDWEVELAVVIGQPAKELPDDADVTPHIAGYCIANDVSERVFQKQRGGGQWTKGKGCDTFLPLGPYLVTPDDPALPPIHALEMTTHVNGDRRQTGSPRTMIFSIPHLIRHLSGFFTLEPGDLLLTGTPPGVGAGMTPPQFLQPGDQLTLAITALGQQHSTCRAPV